MFFRCLFPVISHHNRTSTRQNQQMSSAKAKGSAGCASRGGEMVQRKLATALRNASVASLTWFLGPGVEEAAPARRGKVV